MAEEYTPYTIEHDETRKSWKVKLKGKEVDCDSESDADVISDIPCLFKELEDKTSPYDDYLIQRLQQTVDVMEKYQIDSSLNFATRKLFAIYKKIPKKREW